MKNIKLPLSQPNNNKKYCKNIKKTLETGFKIFPFKGILDVSLCFSLPIFTTKKIDKYKRKYRGNYSGKKKIKTKQKNDDVSFIPTELSTEFIPSVKSLVNLDHCLSCQLQRESPTENFVGIFQRALELFTS
jgi:hypothetical protein